MEYLIHGGRYVSCVHEGGLSCTLNTFTAPLTVHVNNDFSVEKHQGNIGICTDTMCNKLINYAEGVQIHFVIICIQIGYSRAWQQVVMTSELPPHVHVSQAVRGLVLLGNRTCLLK